MILCLCEGLSDRVIRQAIRDGARTVRQVRDRCGAARRCGSCACDIRRMLREGDAHRAPAARLAAK